MIRALLLATSGLAGIALLQRQARSGGRTEGSVTVAPDETARADVTGVTPTFLMGFVLPLWLAPGVADYLCHRATDISVTVGTRSR